MSNEYQDWVWENRKECKRIIPLLEEAIKVLQELAGAENKEKENDMKYVLEFDGETDNFEFRCASRAGDMYSALTEVERILRNWQKYGYVPDDKQLVESADRAMTEARDEVREVLNMIE